MIRKSLVNNIYGHLAFSSPEPKVSKLKKDGTQDGVRHICASTLSNLNISQTSK